MSTNSDTLKARTHRPILRGLAAGSAVKSVDSIADHSTISVSAVIL